MTDTLPHTRNLFLAAEGPSLDYGGGTLFISDLNPQTEIQWRMGRLELFLMGMRCIGEALEAPADLPQVSDRPRFIIALVVVSTIFAALFWAFLHYATPTRPTDRIPGEHSEHHHG